MILCQFHPQWCSQNISLPSSLRYLSTSSFNFHTGILEDVLWSKFSTDSLSLSLSYLPSPSSRKLHYPTNTSWHISLWIMRLVTVNHKLHTSFLHSPQTDNVLQCISFKITYESKLSTSNKLTRYVTNGIKIRPRPATYADIPMPMPLSCVGYSSPANG